MGNRLVVQFARGNRPRGEMAPYPPERAPPRTRRTVYRMTVTGLLPETSWQVSFKALKNPRISGAVAVSCFA